MRIKIDPEDREYLENLGIDVDTEIKIALKEMEECTSDANIQMRQGKN